MPPANIPTNFLNRALHYCFTVFRKFFSSPGLYDGINGKTVMPEQFTQSVYRRSFHFKIRNAVLAEIGIRQAVNEIRDFVHPGGALFPAGHRKPGQVTVIPW